MPDSLLHPDRVYSWRVAPQHCSLPLHPVNKCKAPSGLIKKCKFESGLLIKKCKLFLGRVMVPPTGAATDINGIATLIIPKDKDLVEISFLGPYTRLKIERPTDSIYFDLNSKKATFYNNKKKVKTRKQIVSGY